MIAEFEKHINHQFSFLKDKKLLIAVSGGIDSMVLANLLHTLNYTIAIAHCNFKLRGQESELDEKFVQDIAIGFKYPHYTTSFETELFAKNNSISIQMAARELRYKWFEKIRLEIGFDYVLTAHNKNDVLETFLINFTRGTGLSGLTGIPIKNGTIIRPLLEFSREAILEYAKHNNIKWREDASNVSTKYVRNKIRHDVIPVLKELNPSLMDSLNNTLIHLKGSQRIIDDTIKKLKTKIFSEKKGVIHISISEINKISNPNPYLYELLKPYGFTEWNDVSNLINAQSGKQVFSATHRLLKNRDSLLLTPIKNNPTTTSFKIESPVNLKTELFEISFLTEDTTKNKRTLLADNSKLTFPLTLRKRKDGDIFYPSGMHGKKKVSKFFKDEKLSQIEKENTWILENGDQKIIWIIGKRADRRFEPNENSSKKIGIRFKLLA